MAAAWSRRMRRVAACGWLAALSCSPVPKHTVVVVLVGEDGTTRRRASDEMPLWYAFEAIDFDDDGAEELLAASHEGVFTIDGDGDRTRLSEERVVLALWRPDDAGMAGHLFTLGEGAGSIRHCVCDPRQRPVCRAADETVGIGVHTFTVADLGDDGVLDVLTWGSHQLVAYPGRVSDGGLRWAEGKSLGDAPPAFGDAVPQLLVGDVDHDGHDDVVAGAGDRLGEVSVLFGAPDGRFAHPAVTLADPGEVVRVALADLTGDGEVELVALDPWFDATAMVYFALGDRRLEPTTVEGPSDTSVAMTLGDFARGGPAELLIVDIFERRATLTSFAEDGTPSSRTLALPKLAEGHAAGVFAVDLAGDGTDDVVLDLVRYAD